MPLPTIAIIGAGLTGLTLAGRLKHKANITLFDKSRGVGGRLSTRYAGDYEFDHGAQTIQATHPEFITFMKYLEADGIVAAWQDGYVGVPKMNAIGKHLAKELHIKAGTHISSVTKTGEHWKITDNEGNDVGIFDVVICTAPPEQNCVIMPDIFSHKDAIRTRKLRGCYGLMLGFETAPNITIPELESDIIKSIVKNHEKPSRDTRYSLMILTHYDWAEARMETDSNEVKTAIINAASTLCGTDLNTAEHQALHTWRYANVKETGIEAGYSDASLKLAACGDWCLNGDAESAYLSALHTATSIEELL